MEHWLMVGTGNMAWHWAQAFEKQSTVQWYVVSRNNISEQNFIALCPHVLPNNRLTRAPDGIAFFVPDTEIENQSNNFARLYPTAWHLHSSGATSIDQLKAKKKHVVYPIQSLSKGIAIDWATFPVALESNTELPHTLNNWIQSTPITTLTCTSEERLALHTAAVLSSNFITHLLTLTAKVAEQYSFPLSILEPLVQQAIEKAFQHGPQQTQTGPAVRNDQITIDKHLEVLSPFPEILKIYRILTESIQKKM
ncbi:MAG: DUF2520 domain-containing protein [Cytophagaceae bacterium]|jgi:predicted short-subunit dehydrogenase-like oxidoreductase (DUF2520 family)|nr:DUF2520 domain-containing protein [Cytophagaceae bacterium]